MTIWFLDLKNADYVKNTIIILVLIGVINPKISKYFFCLFTLLAGFAFGLGCDVGQVGWRVVIHLQLLLVFNLQQTHIIITAAVLILLYEYKI